MATALQVGAAECARVVSANTTNAQVLLAAPGRLLGVYVFSTSASIRYLKFYDKATAPSVGTDVPVLTVQVSNIGANGNPREVGSVPPEGMWFANGIAIAIVSGVEDTDNTALNASGEVYAHMFLKRGA